MTSAVGVLHDGTSLLSDRSATSRFLDEHGYLFVRGVLDHGLVDRLRRSLIAAIRAQGAPGCDAVDEIRLRTEDDVDYGRLTRDFSCQELWEDPATARLLEAVLGAPSRPPEHEMLRYLPAGVDDYLLPPHQDRHFIEDEFVAVWVPLNGITIDGGGLGIADGSNQRGYLPHHEQARRSFRSGMPYPGLSETEVTEPWLTAAFEPGDALFFLPCTIHKTLPNRSVDGRTRLSTDNRILASGPAGSATARGL